MIEDVTPASPNAVRRALFRQRWADLAFLHWPADPADVAPLLPPGTEPDVLHGVTYVGLVPFRMSRVRILGSPPVPYLGEFLETNVRLYSVDGRGRRGVVFRSLEATRLVPVLTARWGFGLPYTWSRMTYDRRGDEAHYRSRRRWPRGEVWPAACSAAVRIGDRVEAGELEQFLTNRWALHTAHLGRTWFMPNVHGPWPLHSATLLHLDENLVAAAGLPGVAGPPTSVLWSPGVTVKFGRPSAL